MRNGAGRGRVTPQAVCVGLHSFAHGVLLLSIFFLTEHLQNDWLYSSSPGNLGVFNVMTHSRHVVPKGALCVLLFESLRLEQEWGAIPPSNFRVCIWPWVYKLDWFLFEFMVDLNFQVLLLE